MNNKNFYLLLNVLLGVFLVVFCVAPKLSSLCLIIFSISVIYGWVSRKLDFQWNHPGFWLLGLYLAYLIGCIFTQDSSLAIKCLEYKIPFLLFPFILSLNCVKVIRLPIIATSLVFGLLVLSLIGYVNALFCFFDTGGIGCFLTVSISPVHHPSYFVVFHVLTLAFVWKGYFDKWRFYRLNWVIPFTLFSIVTQSLALSLAGLLYLFILGVILVLCFVKKRFGLRYFTISSVFIPIIASFIFLSIPQFRGEFNGAFKFVKAYVESPTKFVESRKPGMTGSETRLVMWTLSGIEIIKNPWGVGTGNVDIHLAKSLKRYKQSHMIKYNYNPHNQFLQTTLEIGFIGFLLLLGFMAHISYIAWRTRNWILLLLVTNLFFNSLFESMLQRQSGVVFYIFFICLFYSSIKKTT